MFWKIYFVFITLLSIPLYLIGVLSISLELSRGFVHTYELTFLYRLIIDLVSIILLLISLFGLAWKKKIFLRMFWIIHFPLSALWNLSNAYFTYDGLFTIVITAIYLPTLLGAFVTLMPVIAREVFGGGPAMLGTLVGAAGLGGVVATAFLATRSSMSRLDRLTRIACGMAGFSLAAFSFTSTPTMWAVHHVASQAVLQEPAPDMRD